jgi:hypothetical protein
MFIICAICDGFCCRARSFKFLEHTLVDELFDKWGGRPRYTLVSSLDCLPCPSTSPSPLYIYLLHPPLQEKAHDPSAQALLEHAIGTSDLMVVVRCLGQPSGSHEASDRQVPILLCFCFLVCGVVGVEGSELYLVCILTLALFRLLTIEVDEGYASYKMAFASTYVADSVSGECEPFDQIHINGICNRF